MSTFGERLWEHNLRISVSTVRNGPRVRAYTAEGVQCGLPGLGEGEENRLTFPQHWTAFEALNSGEWVRFATEVEKAGEAEECKTGGSHWDGRLRLSFIQGEEASLPQMSPWACMARL